MRIILSFAEMVHFYKLVYIHTASPHSVVKFCHTCDKFRHFYSNIPTDQGFVKVKYWHVRQTRTDYLL